MVVVQYWALRPLGAGRSCRNEPLLLPAPPCCNCCRCTAASTEAICRSMSSMHGRVSRSESPPGPAAAYEPRLRRLSLGCSCPWCPAAAQPGLCGEEQQDAAESPAPRPLGLLQREAR